ncbi:MAG: peptidoglycan-binding protein [Chthoniobacterales bacterium]
MKKITNLLSIVASLAMAGAVMAQAPTPDESQPPGKDKNKAPKHEQPATKPGPERAPKSEKSSKSEKSEAPGANNPAVNQAPAMTPPTSKADRKAPKNQKNVPPTTTAPNTNVDQSATSAATPDVTKNQSRRNNKNSKTSPSTTPPTATTSATPPSPKSKASASPAAEKTTTSPAPTTTATTPAAPTTPAPTTAATTPVTTGSPSAAPSASQANSTTAANPAAAKKPDPAKIQQIKQQHQNFTAQPRPDRVPPVTFSAGYRLPGAEQWQGPQYEVYRSYHPERHDRGWYSSHHQRVELIAGGYYYLNNGYWYPAWGYDPGHEYYAYDAPIYVGHRAEPPDKVIADVQAALQDMGYYRGEVDGLLGPLTREALTGYQRDNGMTVTAVIDEPTLDSLNMG